MIWRKWVKLFKRKGKTSRAQALVELALVLPVLLMALFVIIEISRLFHAWLVVENGARFGVRYAVTGEYNPAYCAGGATEDGKCINSEDETYARVVSIHDVVWAESSSVMRKEEGEVGNTEPGFFNVVVCDPANLVAPVNTFDSYICSPCEVAEDHVNKLAAPLQQASIAVDATSSGRFSGDISQSHTTGSGTNRLMLVGISVSEYGMPSINSAKYGSQNLTLVGSKFIPTGDYYEGVFIYYLKNPTSGTANVVIDYASNPDFGSVVGVMTFTGVDQTTPLRAFASASGTSSSASVNVSSATGELVFDTLMNSYDKAITVGANQMQRWNNQGEPTAGGSTEAGASTVTMSWSWSYSNPWAIGAVSIKPVTSTPTPTTGPTNTPTSTPTNTATKTNTPVPSTATFTPTKTPTKTNTPTNTPTDTPTNTPEPPTATFTPTNKATYTTEPPTATRTPTNTPANTPIPPTVTNTPTIGPTSTILPGCEDPCEPGEHVIIVAEFNHPLLMPILSSIWPELRLTSMREAIIETYYVPPAVGTPPDYVSLTPRPTNTFGPSRTPRPTSPATTPTLTSYDPRCDMIWISNPNANTDSDYIQFEIHAYEWADWPEVVNYRIFIDDVEIWQDEEAGPWVVSGIRWEAWDENGTLYNRYDSYGDDWYYLDYVPDPPFEEKHCLGAPMCGELQYNGRMTIYFGQDLVGEYGIFPHIIFPDYPAISCTKWVPWTSPNWITDTPVEGGDPPEDPTASPIPPTEGSGSDPTENPYQPPEPPPPPDD